MKAVEFLDSCPSVRFPFPLRPVYSLTRSPEFSSSIRRLAARETRALLLFARSLSSLLVKQPVEASPSPKAFPAPALTATAGAAQNALATAVDPPREFFTHHSFALPQPTDNIPHRPPQATGSRRNRCFSVISKTRLLVFSNLPFHSLDMDGHRRHPRVSNCRPLHRTSSLLRRDLKPVFPKAPAAYFPPTASYRGDRKWRLGRSSERARPPLRQRAVIPLLEIEWRKPLGEGISPLPVTVKIRDLLPSQPEGPTQRVQHCSRFKFASNFDSNGVLPGLSSGCLLLKRRALCEILRSRRTALCYDESSCDVFLSCQAHSLREILALIACQNGRPLVRF